MRAADSPGETSPPPDSSKWSRRWSRLAEIVAAPAEPGESTAERVSRGALTLHLWTIFGLALSNLLLFVSFLAALWSRASLLSRWQRLRPILLPLAIYLLATLVAVAASRDPGVSVSVLGELLSLLTLILAPLLLTDRRRVRTVLDGLLLVVGACALLGLLQFFYGYGGLDQRIRGPFSHTMTFSGIVLLADCMLIARLVGRNGRRHHWLWWLLLAIYNLALVGSLTRSSWLAFGITLTVLLLLRAPRLLLAYLPAAALFVLLAPAAVVSRVVSIADLQDLSNYDRIAMAEAGVHMIARRPVTGLGPGMMEELYPLFRHPTAPNWQRPHLHNSVLELAAERGLPAALAYIWIMVVVLMKAISRFRVLEARDESGAVLFLGVALALVAFNCAGMFENNWGDTEVQRVMLFLMAIPFCLPRRRDDALEQSAASTATAESEA